MFVWRFWSDAGAPIATVPSVDNMLWLILKTLRVSLSDINKITMVVQAWIGTCSVYFLASTLFHCSTFRRQYAFLAAVLTLYMPTLIMDTYKNVLWWISPFPLIPAFAMIGTRTYRTVYAVLAGLVTFLLFRGPSVGTMNSIGFITCALLFYWIMRLGYARAVKGENIVRDLVYVYKFVFIFVCVSIIVNLYWILPLILNAHSYSSVLSSFSPNFFFNQWSTFSNILRLFGYWGFYNSFGELPFVPYASVYLHNPIVMLLTFTIPLLAFSAILLDRSRNTICLTLATAITALLSTGTNPPLGGLYSLIAQTSILKAFYISYTWVALLALEYSLLIGITIARVSSRIGRRYARPSVKVVVKFLAACTLTTLVMINSWPLVTGDVLINWWKPDELGVTVPDSYYTTAAWFDRQSGYYRIAITPHVTTYLGTEWGFQGPSAFYEGIFTQPLITGLGVPYLSWVDEGGTLSLIDLLYEIPAKHPLLENRNDTLLGRINSSPWMSYQQDTVDVVQNDFPWDGQTSILWTLNASTSGVHAISYSFSASQDWSNYDTLVLWTKSSPNSQFPNFGVGSVGGPVGWYGAGLHIANVSESWTMVSLPLPKPTEGPFNITEVDSVWANYNVPENLSTPTKFWIGGFCLAVSKPNSVLWANMLGLFNVKYVLVDDSINLGLADGQDSSIYKEIMDDSSLFSLVANNEPLSIYENKLFSRLVYCASSLYSFDNIYEALDIMSSSSFNTEESAFVFQNHSLYDRMGSLFSSRPTMQPSNVTLTILHRNPTQLLVETTAESPFIFVFSEAFDSGWIASVDGQEVTEHFMINGYSNGWYVENTGKYTLIVKYVPQDTYELGLVISYSSVIVILIGVGISKYWRKNRLILEQRHKLDIQRECRRTP